MKKFAKKQLQKKIIIKSGTIFRLEGDIWGYDITLFSKFDEKEILVEPERNIIVKEAEELNEIINITCEISKTPLVLETIEIWISKDNENKPKMFQCDHQLNHGKHFFNKNNDNIKKSDIPTKINNIDDNDNYFFKEEEENKKIKWHENRKNQKPDLKIRSLSKSLVLRPRININDITNDNKINMENNNKR